MTEPKIVSWVIAHEPVHLFVRTARAFADEIEKTSKGKLVVEILTVEDYLKKDDKAHLDPYGNLGVDSIFNALEDGRIAMSQTITSAFGLINKNFLALDLPFLFKDHDHVTSVMEGSVGRELCESLGEKSGMKGLAFTYSGGYRIIGSNRPIDTLTALQQSSVRIGPNPVNYVTMKALGADPKQLSRVGYGYDVIEQGSTDVTETTYLRFKGNHILKTQHNMYMTTIAVSTKFWNELDAETQELFQAAAIKAAQIERQWSIEDCDKFERECVENGVEIHELTASERAQFEEMTKSVYTDVEEWFSPGLVEKLKMH
jgi:TRAP-type C4-dicarboxylate transport system substrate-binding protein